MTGVQVFLGDRLVGVLRNPPFSMNEIPSEFPILQQTEDVLKYGADAGSIGNMIWVNIARRFREVSRLEMMRIQEISSSSTPPSPTLLAKFFDIPGYATRDEMPMRDSVRFSWRVAAPTLDQYEIMFDMPNFEPV